MGMRARNPEKIREAGAEKAKTQGDRDRDPPWGWPFSIGRASSAFSKAQTLLIPVHSIRGK